MSNIRTYRVNHAMQMISIPLHSTTNSYHLGNNDEVVDAKGVVQQVTNYYPFGAPYADATAVKDADFQPYKYNGKELDLMHGLNTYDYGARQHDPILARWDRIDPLCEKYYSTSPYAYCMNNPVRFIDPDGRRWDEYDVNGKKISNLGGNSIDFYHQKDNSIIIKNRANGITNTMKDDMISGYTHRSNSTSWFQITHEFISEYGPTKSLFSDFTGSGEGPFKSLESSSSTYLGKAIDDIMENNAEKNLIKVTTSDANPISAGTDMWEQMIGEANISWYDLGDRTLFMLTDSKSNTSLLYHLPVQNRERGEATSIFNPCPGHGNTYQTYIWTLSKKRLINIYAQRNLEQNK